MTLNSRPILAALLGVVALAVAGCPDDPTLTDDLAWKDKVGAGEIVVDATSEDAWTYLSFAERKVIATPEKPEESLAWDVAFRRYNMKTNGGTSGKGQGAVCDLGEVKMEETEVAKVTGWTVDAMVADARTGNEIGMNSVLSGWYSYHFFKHEVLSQYHLYAVKAADGRVATFLIRSYYDTAGTPGFVRVLFRFPMPTTDAPLETDGGSPTDGGTPEVIKDDVINEANGVVTGETNFDARGAKTYLAFSAKGKVETPADPKAAATWDVSFNKWLLETNSGTSGTAQGGAKAAGTTDFAAATEAPADGYGVDDIETIGAEQRLESTNAALAGWFDYDPTNQKIASKKDVFWIRTADGKFAKLQILGYYHPEGAEAFYRLKWAYRADGGRAF